MGFSAVHRKLGANVPITKRIRGVATLACVLNEEGEKAVFP